MWTAARAVIGIVLVLFILAIVVSPYVDLPLTTAGTQPSPLLLSIALAIAWVVGACRPAAGGEAHVAERQRCTSIHQRGLLDVNCILLC